LSATLSKWKERLLLALITPAWTAFERACSDPERAQTRAWRGIRRTISKGAYWQSRFAGDGIPERLEDFPISSYSDYADPIARAFSGATSPLNGEPVRFWCVSSGTTGARKLFPLTKSQSRQSARAALPLFHHALRAYPGVASGKAFFLVAPFSGERSPAGTPVGLLSTSLYLGAPTGADAVLAVPRAIVESAPLFEEWAGLYAMAADLSCFVGMTPLGTCRFLAAMEERWDRYRAILLGEAALPDGLPRLRVPRDRREHLRRFFEAYPAEPGSKRRPFPMTALWPNLRVHYGWRSSICEAQLPLLDAYVSEGPVFRDGAYAATEATFNVVLDGELGGPFHPGSHVLEFLPLDREAVAANLLKPWELESGRDYEVVITNGMGLVRYRIFDVARCLGFHHRSPVLSFRYKSQDRIGLDLLTLDTGEVLEAAAAAGLALDGEAVCAPSPGGDRLLVYVVAGSSAREDAVRRLDPALRARCAAYAEYRAKEALPAIERVEVPASDPAFAAIFPAAARTGIRAQEKARAVHSRSPIGNGDLERLRSARPGTVLS
jgi:hypothetical protein